MKLKEFNELYLGRAIHCKTEELANEFLALADSLGFIWGEGDKLTNYNEWKEYKNKTYYRIYCEKDVRYGEIDDTDLPIIEFKGEIK